ncbi:type II toxin-antitoxin system HigA family antitoxin [Pleionea sp. CnH1-48]|uniref:helix-turn-helix domain-containing protein n=1 Tax=Pleionea sp. CnH1-48 TaxID=2954494 RepID=UPI0020970AB1|nr:helix-turn-helix domain-containing protein [Pleionea sp. CnH1-48]MCO7225713.1 helix-turn-helix domain-containing protein [Pleionea sp. CnH1-48]
MNEQLQTAIDHWGAVAPMIQCPSVEQEYETLLEHMEEALTLANGNPDSPLNSLIQVMAQAIKQYEEQNIMNATGGGISALRYLMKVHKIKQSDLKEVGSQGVVSEILNGKRSLTVRHIRALSKRFGISPNTFLEP